MAISKLVCIFAMMTEIWKDIEGYENLYQVSSEGRIKSLNYLKTGKEKILKGGKYGSGYLKVKLFKDGKGKNYAIHRLVAQAFIENPENKPCIDHINTDKTDNRVKNLRWVNQKENMNNPLSSIKQHNRFYGKIGYKMPASKTVVQLDKNGEIIKLWLCAMDAVREGNFTQEHISSCCRGKIKSHKGYRWQYLEDWLSEWWDKNYMF